MIATARKHSLLTIISGLITLTAEIPMPDFAMPYAAPKLDRTIAMLQPIAPKKDYEFVRFCEHDIRGIKGFEPHRQD